LLNRIQLFTSTRPGPNIYDTLADYSSFEYLGAFFYKRGLHNCRKGFTIFEKWIFNMMIYCTLTFHRYDTCARAKWCIRFKYPLQT